MALSGLWKSTFSKNPARSRLPRLLPAVYLNIGEPVSPQQVTPEELRETVIALQAERI
jgi:hypothetical protein